MAEPGSAHAGPGDRNRVRVVLADDVAGIRQLVRALLEASGRFSVVAEAGTGREAIEAVAAHRPALLLLDLSMPDMDGFTALPDILRLEPAPLVVVLSAHSDPELRSAVLAAGASAYLDKGSSPRELVQHLLHLIDTHRVP